MKLRMAENSLFAILLRSRWWISLLIAAGFVLLSYALLPESLRIIGALGGFPFVVIAVMALKRQWGQPSPARAEALLAQAAAMPWPAFADALAAAWTREGWQVTRLPGPVADFALQRAGRTTLVHARRWKAARLGAEPLRELQQAVERHPADGGLVVALGTPSDAALALAKNGGPALLTGAALAKLLRALPPAASR